MQEMLLPLFPLELVLLPNNLLPLHIFEDRYKEMIGEAIQSKTEFGVVQAGEKGINNLGCTATVQSVTEQYSTGAWTSFASAIDDSRLCSSTRPNRIYAGG